MPKHAPACILGNASRWVIKLTEKLNIEHDAMEGLVSKNTDNMVTFALSTLALVGAVLEQLAMYEGKRHPELQCSEKHKELS
jgi:hypothetical protein